MRAGLAVIVALTTAVVAAASAAVAEDGSSASLIRALEAQVGVTVTHGGSGDRTFTEWRKNGVSYRLERHGSTESMFGD